jgi:hypothetical protein
MLSVSLESSTLENVRFNSVTICIKPVAIPALSSRQTAPYVRIDIFIIPSSHEEPSVLEFACKLSLMFYFWNSFPRKAAFSLAGLLLGSPLASHQAQLSTSL